MIEGVGNHLWQSTLFVLLAAVTAGLFRNHRAAIRHGVWMTASLKFLVPFGGLIALGSRIDWSGSSVASPAVSSAMTRAAEPFSELIYVPVAQVAQSSPESFPWIRVLAVLWVLGTLSIVVMRIREWLRIRSIVRNSLPLEADRIQGTGLPDGLKVRAAPGLLEPGVVGWLRPVLLLPAGLEDHLTPGQLSSILAHEAGHVWRRDNLTSAVHMLVEAIFWFHPLVWWIGARLLIERERACDEAVLHAGGDPQEYAEGIVQICRRYVESPLSCVSGVTGGDLKQRIEGIMQNKEVFGLDGMKKAMLAATGVAALLAPVAIGLLHAPESAVAATTELPEIVSVSVRPTENCNPGPIGPNMYTGGIYSLRCLALSSPAFKPQPNLIRMAYGLYADGVTNPMLNVPEAIEGPDWLTERHVDIDIQVNGDPSSAVLGGPVLQKVLEDTFGLQVHRGDIEVPVYELHVGSNGPKLKFHEEGSCVPWDLNRVPLQPPSADSCTVLMKAGPEPSTMAFDAKGVTLGDFVKLASKVLDRPLIDKTGLTGFYDFDLVVGIDEHMAVKFGGTDSPSSQAPGILQAIMQLGLTLEPATGESEFFIVDEARWPF